MALENSILVSSTSIENIMDEIGGETNSENFTG